MEQEYIKGDIVMYDSRVHTIMDTLGVNNYELSYISHPVHQLELSGVPITPEILDNNRWRRLKSKRYTWWRARFDGVYYFVKPNKDYPSVWELCRGNTRRRFEKIRYVHQLQHFLFGLGLNSEMEV